MPIGYDVVIVGGGVAGCSTALALRKRGAASIAILHKPESRPFRTGETLQPQARGLLETLGIYEDFLRVPSLAAHGVCSAWGGEDLIYNDNIFRLNGYGYLLDRTALDKCFMEKARSIGIDIIDASFSSHRKQGLGRSQLRMTCGVEISARFVVDATGRRAVVARSFGVPRNRFDELQAVYTLWRGRPEKFPRHTLIEGVENGWCYAVALPDDQFVVAIFADKAFVKQQKLKQLDQFLLFVDQATHVKSLLQGTPEFLQGGVVMADSCVLEFAGSEQGWLAVGDAASAYDPLSSIGIAKAMEGGIQAADAISGWLDGTPGSVDAYCENVQIAFEHYLKQRCYYYKQEARWSQRPFWKSRQEWLGVHPQWLIQNRDPLNARLPDKILSSSQLSKIKSICSGRPRPAHEVVREYQDKLPRKIPDWLVIQALGFLIETEHVVVSERVPPATQKMSNGMTTNSSLERGASI